MKGLDSCVKKVQGLTQVPELAMLGGEGRGGVREVLFNENVVPFAADYGSRKRACFY